MFPSSRFASQMMQMAVQAPFVMAMRMGDWWQMDATHSPRTTREAGRMVAEKQAAAMESWAAMGTHAMQAWTRVMLAPLQPVDAAQLDRAGQAMLAPYSRRVRANAARLRRRAR